MNLLSSRFHRFGAKWKPTYLIHGRPMRPNPFAFKFASNCTQGNWPHSLPINLPVMENNNHSGKCDSVLVFPVADDLESCSSRSISEYVNVSSISMSFTILDSPYTSIYSHRSLIDIVPGTSSCIIIKSESEERARMSASAGCPLHWQPLLQSWSGQIRHCSLPLRLLVIYISNRF